MGKRHKPEEIIGKLREAEIVLAQLKLQKDELDRETARLTLAAWRDDYNTVRPHSAIGNVPPAVYAKLGAPGMQRDGARSPRSSAASRPVASPSSTGSNEEQTLPIAG